MVTTGESAPAIEERRCANCAHALAGPFCSRCGQEALDLHRPVHALLSDVVGDIFNLDTRLAHTVVPLLAKPGEVTRRYLNGHRVSYVPPLKTYLIAALIFFGLFSLFPESPQVAIYTEGTPEAAAARGRGRSQMTVALPASLPVFNEQFCSTCRWRYSACTAGRVGRPAPS